MGENPEHIDAQLSLDELNQKVAEQIGYPVNVWAVAATLESLGIRDIDARNDYGYDSVFDLGEYLYRDIREAKPSEMAGTGQRTGDRFIGTLWNFIKYYAHGLVFSLPMFSQVVAVLLFGYSLWAWLEFNEAQATVVAFGTIAAFVLTGGFIQVLGKSVLRHFEHKEYRMALEVTRSTTKWAILLLSFSAMGIYLLNIIIPFYPHSMVLLSLVYLELIGLLLIASGVLYALKQRLMILVGVVIGTAFVIAGMDLLHLGIYLSQWIGMAISVIFLAGYGFIYLYVKIKFGDHDEQEDKKPLPAEIQYYYHYRYFVYGTLYFLFLFLDRLLAWSAGPPPPPYLIWFNTPYELGMDWALISLVLNVAVLEYCIHTFSKQLMPFQKMSGIMNGDRFNDHFKKFYLQQVALVVVVGILSIAISFVGINSLKTWSTQVPEIRDFFANPMTYRVFWIASVSYLFLTIGLLHALFFFTLNRASFVMYAIIVAVMVNFIIGYIASRVWSLEYATVGLLAGSVVFALLTGWKARDFFNRLDYYYYSAF